MGVRVQEGNFDIAGEIENLRGNRTDIGAIVSFTGTVREMTSSGPIASMTLEHYPGMTALELERVEAEANRRWPLTGSTIIHRFGTLAPGENIVLVVTASAHRQAAFEAAQFLMDYLKTSAPFWKKETRSDGASAWVEEKSDDIAARRKWHAPESSEAAE